MAKYMPWTRDQQLIALRLYVGTPFGKLHRGNPEIIALAARIGRTPDALAMKACNFASLDPGFRETNRKGLSGASTADGVIWREFAADSERLAAEAEEAFARFDPERAAKDEADVRIPTGETDIVRVVRARRVQSFFRAAVLTSYGYRCALSDLAIPELLNASHIIPWSADTARRADPRNGIALNALYDRAFDRGLITLDKSLRVVISARLMTADPPVFQRQTLLDLEGRQLKLPSRFVPDDRALEYHRDHVFQSEVNSQSNPSASV